MKKRMVNTPGRLSRIFLDQYFRLKESKEGLERKDSFSSLVQQSAKMQSRQTRATAASMTSTERQETSASKFRAKMSKSPDPLAQLEEDQLENQIDLNPRMSVVGALKPVARSIIDIPETRAPSEGGGKMRLSNPKEVRINTLLTIEDP